MNCEWTGNGNRNDYDDPKNWVDGRVPRDGDTAALPAGRLGPTDEAAMFVQCGCGGIMEWTGVIKMSYPGFREAKCDKCGTTQDYPMSREKPDRRVRIAEVQDA